MDSTEPPRLASLSERFLAFYVDLIVIRLGLVLLFLAIAFGSGFKVNPDSLAKVFAAVLIPVFLLYHASFVAWKGATPGKKVFGIVVERAQGLGYARSLGRSCGYLLSFLGLGLGFAWPLLNAERKAWHDYLAGTRVIALRVRGPWMTWALRLAAVAVVVLTLAISVGRRIVQSERDNAEIVSAADRTARVLGALEERYKSANGAYTDDAAKLATAAKEPEKFLEALRNIFVAESLRITLSQEGYTISAQARDARGTVVSFDSRQAAAAVQPAKP